MSLSDNHIIAPLTEFIQFKFTDNLSEFTLQCNTVSRKLTLHFQNECLFISLLNMYVHV